MEKHEIMDTIKHKPNITKIIRFYTCFKIRLLIVSLICAEDDNILSC